MLLFGCDKSEFEIAQKKEIDQMKWLLHATPMDDFEDAIKKKDYRFIGLYGNKNIVPIVNIACLNVKA